MDYTKTWLPQENYRVYKLTKNYQRKNKQHTKRLKVIILASVLLLFLVGCRGPQTIEYTDPETVSYELTGDITDNEEAQKAMAVIEKNLEAVSEGNLEMYLETIVSDGVEETEAELQESFDILDLEVTVLAAEVEDQEEDIMLIRVYQQTVAENSAFEDREYRDHVAEANYTLVKEADEWKIQQTVMTNNQFIEYEE